MVFFAFVHLATVYFTKAYRKPREVTWITGCLLLFLAMGFGFSGYLLPWNQLASAFPATCCLGTSWPSLPPRLEPTSPERCHWSVNGPCGSCAGASALPVELFPVSMAGMSPSSQR
jgi:hypothetical protein